MTSGHDPRTLTVMAHGWSLATASVLLGACALTSACSSSVADASASSTPVPSSTSVTVLVDPVQGYLDAVNALCDALLPKVVAVTKGGSLDIPLKDFFAQLPAHAKLRSDFDRDVALIPVPPQAQDRADALKNYVRYANELDAKRLAAANQGAAAYAKEIKAELATAANDPSIAARNAAGFHDSCDAR